MENFLPPEPQRRIDKVLNALKRDYVIIGNGHIKAWHAWLILGLVVGVAAGIILVANRSGEVEEGRAVMIYNIPSRPNIIVLMTDDQDLNSMWTMENVKKLLGDNGFTFTNSFVSYSICCPSRATFLTGQYAHNHGVLSNNPPSGGFGKLDHFNTLAVWLKNAGYYTSHIGKYLNGYGEENTPLPGPACLEVPPGWDEWYGGVDPYNYQFYNYVFNENGQLFVYGKPSPPLPGGCPVAIRPVQYRTDLDKDKAVDFIKRRAGSQTPFFLSVAFLAPHEDMSLPLGPEPAPRHKEKFSKLPLPQPPSFNEKDLSDKPLLLRLLPPIGFLERRVIETWYQRRMASLLAVDEAVAEIVKTLSSTNQLQNTVIVFTSDNGYFHGEHRLPAGKGLLYEESIRVPLVIFVPGVPGGKTINELVVNIDLAPTVLELTGVSPGRVIDGRSLVPFFTGRAANWRTALLLEGGNVATTSPASDNELANLIIGMTSYSAVRTTGYVYGEYGNGEEELYDLKADPYQLESKHKDLAYSNIRDQLRQLLDILRACSGTNCWQ